MKIRDDNVKIRDFPEDKDPYINTSLVRANNILLCLSNGINTNIEIAKYCNYSTSTVHRLLQVLRNMNWVIQDDVNRRYYLGPVVTQLGANNTAAHRFLVANAAREMLRLASLTRETVNLVVMVQLHYVLLHEIPSKQDIKISDDGYGFGQLIPVAATGKVLLSQMEDKEIVEALRNIILYKKTENTVIDKDELLEQIRQVRKQGYAVTHGERIGGAMGISVPVVNYTYPAALSLVGPETRIRTAVDAIIKELTTSAMRICGNIAKSHKQGG